MGLFSELIIWNTIWQISIFPKLQMLLNMISLFFYVHCRVSPTARISKSDPAPPAEERILLWWCSMRKDFFSHFQPSLWSFLFRDQPRPLFIRWASGFLWQDHDMIRSNSRNRQLCFTSGHIWLVLMKSADFNESYGRRIAEIGKALISWVLRIRDFWAFSSMSNKSYTKYTLKTIVY